MIKKLEGMTIVKNMLKGTIFYIKIELTPLSLSNLTLRIESL